MRSEVRLKPDTTETTDHRNYSLDTTSINDEL